MISIPENMSWSAVSLGWPSEFLSIADVRSLAETRILAADGEELIPLSSLADLKDDEDRQDSNEVKIHLERLASLEPRPQYFARREWLIFQFQTLLARLPDIGDLDEPELDNYYQMQALECAWQDANRPLDIPPINPFIRYCIENADELGGLMLTVEDIGDWLRSQEQLLKVIDSLMKDGRCQDVEVLAQSFESAQKNATARLQLAQDETAIYERLLSNWQEVTWSSSRAKRGAKGGEWRKWTAFAWGCRMRETGAARHLVENLNVTLWQEIKAHNANELLRRRQRSS